MPLRLKPLLGLILVSAFATIGSAQNTPIVVEAESGTRGAEMASSVDGAVTYVGATTDFINLGNPGSAARVFSIDVTFPAAGSYELYARIRVGASGANDDSFFYGNGFGTKTVTADDDWILVNQLSGAGYTGASETVGGIGSAGQNVWKWVKLSDFATDEAGIKFTVSAGALTQTLQFGAREDGLSIDKLAFGLEGVQFTVSNLDNGTAGSAAPVGSNDPYTPPGPPLASGHSKFLGSAYSSPYQTLHFERYWNQVTPENASKWGSVEGTRDSMNWAALDAAYDFAKANGFSFKFHTLIWGAQQPGWMRNLSAAEQLEEIEEWYAAAAARYPDIDQIDVVNEPIRQPPNGADANRANYMNALGGAGTTGWDWVIQSFRLARQYFPNAQLLINEYSVTNTSTVTNTYSQIIQLLKNENLIDGIGIQQHAFETRGVPTATIRANLDTLATLGLPIYMTEFDVDGATDQVQLEEYQRLFTLFWEHPAVEGITLWGWRPGLWRNEQKAYIVQENGAERTAMLWLKEYLNTGPFVAPQTLTVAEGAAPGTAVGTVAALDWQESTVGSFAIAGGTGASLFAIDATTGQVTVAPGATLAAQSYTLDVTARDSAKTGAAGTVTIHVSNQPQKVVGGGYEFAADILHPGTGNTYDQILITGPTTTFRADPGQITRASYIDMDDDIVQIEFSGSGTVTVELAGITPPALPEKYNQNVSYVKGHATITVAGAGADTHLSAFTVGRATAVNQALFNVVTYDGFADLALVNIASPTNEFAGLRMANVEFWNTSGNTGIEAPGVQFAGPVFVSNIDAQDQATPVLLTGAIGTYAVAGVEYQNTILITGGDMAQASGRAVQVGDVGRIVMYAGSDSHGNLQTAKTNQAVYERGGTDVTTSLIQ